jgi:Fe-S cluster assembly iron-binding protein IscA
MLTLSADATQAIKQVVASTEAGESGGIRFSITPVDQEQSRLELAVATSPEPGDTQVGEPGAKVFLDPEVVPLLDDKILDATLEAQSAAFTILDRSDASSV